MEINQGVDCDLQEFPEELDFPKVVELVLEAVGAEHMANASAAEEQPISVRHIPPSRRVLLTK